MVKRRNGRQDAIRAIVRDKPVRTQRTLVEELREAGFTCTQATVSRDIADMGLRKLPEEGVYVLPEDLQLQRMLSEFVVSAVRANNLVVVRCQAGTGTGVASALDSAGLAHLLGVVADADTVLAVADTDDGAALVQSLVQRLSGTH